MDNNDWNRLQAKYGGLSIGQDPTPVRQNELAQPQKKKRSGIARWLPTAAGVAGTLLAAPLTGGASLLGTAALLGGGAAIGGGLGELGAQRANREKVDIGKAAKESLISGATGAIPIGGAARAAKVANQAAKSGVEQGTEQVAKKNLLSKIKTSAQNVDQEASGLKVGQTLRGGEVLTPERSKELHDFARNKAGQYVQGGVKAGKPIDQATSANDVYKGVISKLDESLGSINRKLKPAEIQTITKNLDQKLIDHPDIVGNTKLADKFKTLVAKKDIKGLEKLRREYDDIAYTAAGKAGNTAKAAEAKALRDTIDDFVTPLSKEYKATKGDYSNAKELLTLTSKGSASAKGAPIPFMNARVLPQATAGIKSKVASKIGGAGAPPTDIPKQKSLLSKVTREGVKQEVGGAILPPVADVALGTNLQDQQAPELTDSNNLDQSSIPDVSQVPGDTQDIGLQQSHIDEAIKQALSSGDTKGLSNLLAVANYYETQKKNSSTSQKPLSAEASKVIANANSGLKSLDQLQSMIQQEGVPKGTILPGRSALGGAVGNIAGTANYDTISRNVTDVISRLRTGAALTDGEVKFYNSQVPQAFDDPETIRAKLSTLRDFFSSVSSRTGSAGTDLSSQLAQ